MNPLRWSGFLSFILLTALLLISGMYFIEPLLKNSLESYLSEKNAASVDIDKLLINYFPLQIQLDNIQLADAQQPTINAIQIGSIRFQLAMDQLLLKKLIVDEMSVNNIQLDTQRKNPATIYRQQKKEKIQRQENKSSFSMSDIDLPDISKLLQKENLQSDKIFADLKEDIKTTEDKWLEIKQDLTEAQRWQEYEQRYATIKRQFKGNTKDKLQALKKAAQLKKDLTRERDKISQASQQFNQDSERLSAEFKQARQAPAGDVQRIKKKYQLDNLNTQNITQMLLGNQAAEYIQLVNRWYKKIQPYIASDQPAEKSVERSRGRYIKFTEYNPQPDILIRHISVSARLARGQYLGEISQLSSDQQINRQPMLFVFTASEMQDRDSEELRGEFNYIQPQQGFIQLNYQLVGEQLYDLTLSSSQQLPLSIQNAIMDVKLQGRLSGDQLAVRGQMDFKQVEFNLDSSSSSNSLAAMMAESFQQIDQFQVNTQLNGRWDKLDVKLQSDLDNKIGKQLKSRLKQKTQQFEQQLTARITEKYKAPLAELEEKQQQLAWIKSAVDEKAQQIEQKIVALKQKIDAQKLAKKQQINDKLQSKKEALIQKLRDQLKP